MTRIALLGATGSIGTQTLEIIRLHREQLEVVALTAQSNVEKLIALCAEFSPRIAVIADKQYYPQLKDALKGTNTQACCAEEGLLEAATMPEADLVLSSLVGFAGFLPTLKAIEQGKTIALANKEVLVAGGECITAAAHKHGARLIPVDSEHSAIYQCLLGETSPVEKIWLTASGGPFLHKSREEMASVTPEKALNHPRWLMGPKVTIDSSTLANKGFEAIEAHYLFGVPMTQIQVVVHPESIVHSMVEFCDGSVKAQLSLPDMRLPISLALGVGKRLPNAFPRLNFFDQTLHFLAPDFDKFPLLRFAYEAMEQGGNTPAILNAADSVAVEAFLRKQIPFTAIPEIAKEMLSRSYYSADASMVSILETDRLVCEACRRYIFEKYR